MLEEYELKRVGDQVETLLGTFKYSSIYRGNPCVLLPDGISTRVGGRDNMPWGGEYKLTLTNDGDGVRILIER